MADRYRLETRIRHTSQVTYHSTLSAAAEAFRQSLATRRDVWIGADVVHQVLIHDDRGQGVGIDLWEDTETYQILSDDRDSAQVEIRRVLK
jgi:hypothetical protein